MAKGHKRESTDFVTDLSTSIESVTIVEDDDKYEDMDTTTTTVRKSGHKRARLSSSPVKSKIRKYSGKLKKKKLDNSPAMKFKGPMNKVHLKKIIDLQQEQKNLSSIHRPNKVVPGHTYIYDNVNSVDELRDTDNALWSKVSHSNTAAHPEDGIGKGTRRQWYGKKDRNLTKVATHYEGNDLGVVRYYYIKEPHSSP